MRRTARALLAALLAGSALLLPDPATAATTRSITYTRWGSATALGTGTFAGTAVDHGRLVVADPTTTTTFDGRQYDVGRWTSPWVTPGYDLTELVASWDAATPGDSFLLVDVRGVTSAGSPTGWDRLSRWAAGDRYVQRTSLGSQTDGGASVAYDTWLVPTGVRQWQVRLSLLRRTGSTLSPAVDTVGAMVSRLPSVASVTTSTPTGVAAGTVLPVPGYSQMVHAGEYPEYDGGGEAWCSPTSTSMVLGYYGKLPPASAYSWVRASYPDRFVDHAARSTFDYSFDGTGNWPFNTAYGARWAGAGFVTRLRSLRDAERFIAAGIPLVASIAFRAGELSGVPAELQHGSNGHLVVIRGFTTSGDVVVNDPAGADDAHVRRTYDRAQFEDAWLKRYPSGGSMVGSGGLVYVVRDPAHRLPARHGATAW